jgi:proteasome lid subunit RPN8/RPN11
MNYDRIFIDPEIIEQIKNHVEIWFPEEACGILAGINETVQKVLPVTNQYHSPVRFYMEPVALLHALEWIEQQQLDLIGIFHSHPKGPEIPSQTDIKEFNYPGTAVIIMSKAELNWTIRAFMINGNEYEEIRIMPNEKT